MLLKLQDDFFLSKIHFFCCQLAIGLELHSPEVSVEQQGKQYIKYV